jgi:hypothetical protein
MAEVSNVEELYVNEKVKKWSDPEYKKKYFREYYHKKKDLKGRTGWTNDPEKVREYHKHYNATRNQELVECPLCKVEVKRKQLSYHNLHSKIHKVLLSRQVL